MDNNSNLSLIRTTVNFIGNIKDIKEGTKFTIGDIKYDDDGNMYVYNGCEWEDLEVNRGNTVVTDDGYTNKKIVYKEIRCKNCNADIEFSTDQDVIKCKYCGSKYYNSAKYELI